MDPMTISMIMGLLPALTGQGGGSKQKAQPEQGGASSIMGTLNSSGGGLKDITSLKGMFKNSWVGQGYEMGKGFLNDVKDFTQSSRKMDQENFQNSVNTVNSGTGYKDGGIHIKPENRGKFTEYKERTGKTTEEALHSSDPHVRQMANFARNAAKWHHSYFGGGINNQNAGAVTNSDLMRTLLTKMKSNTSKPC